MPQILLHASPYTDPPGTGQWDRYRWPCSWVSCESAPAPPFVTAYRLRFSVETHETVRVHVSADERYVLYLDGHLIGCGSERGDMDNWYFETYDLDFAAGEHTLVARVWSLGAQAPFAQMTVFPGFIMSPQEEPWITRIGTGLAAWEAKIVDGYSFIDPLTAWGTGANLVIDGARYPWGIEHGEGEGWAAVQVRDKAVDAGHLNETPPAHLMAIATLPPMLNQSQTMGSVRLVSDFPGGETHAIPIRQADHLTEEGAAWQALIQDESAVTLPPHTRRRVLIDLEEYFCAYPKLEVSGGAGAKIRVNWQEALYDDVKASSKGDRNAIEGKFFVTAYWPRDGIGDTFLPDGGASREFTTLWWQCGRYVEVVIETDDEALTLEHLGISETRYPLERESTFESSDPRLAEIVPLAVRALQMCSHETYMDCPYYEQLMYIGDTRLEVLTTYTVTYDDRLPRKALRMFDMSRMNNGLTQSRYPTRVRQIIPPFSLWWVAMVHDYALWRDDPTFVKRMLPNTRIIVDYFQNHLNSEGLIEALGGWNYMDWVPDWKDGIPADGDVGVSGVISAQFVLVMTQVAQLEEWFGEPELAARAHRMARTGMESIQKHFWDPDRGLLADDLAHAHFSEHMQCLSILSGLLDTERVAQISENLLTAPDLARTTIYFTHYLFETYRKLGRGDAILDRLSLWFDLTRLGLKTTVEMPEPTRSDCHAWGAHPLFHYHASLLGVRPASLGFSEVEIRPNLGSLTWVSGTLPHPKGEISVNLRLEDDTWRGTISLPPGVTGALHLGNEIISLTSSSQDIAVPASRP